jgi:hypothetical protein
MQMPQCLTGSNTGVGCIWLDRGAHCQLNIQLNALTLLLRRVEQPTMSLQGASMQLQLPRQPHFPLCSCPSQPQQYPLSSPPKTPAAFSGPAAALTTLQAMPASGTLLRYVTRQAARWHSSWVWRGRLHWQLRCHLWCRTQWRSGEIGCKHSALKGLGFIS